MVTARYLRAMLPVSTWSGLSLLVRFGLVGLLNTVFSYLVFALLLGAGAWPGVALAGAAAAGTGFNFQTSRRLVFRSSGDALRFVAVYALVLLANWVALALLRRAGMAELEAQALLTLPIAGLSFLGQSTFVFGSCRRNSVPVMRQRRNLIERTTEDFKPPVFKPNTSARDRLENWLRRFLDVQAGSIWRDLRVELGEAGGSMLDIGCGAQIYRDLIPKHVIYCGIDTVDAKARFGYSVPDTHYFDGEDWGVMDGSFDTALCTEVLEHIAEPVPFLARMHRCLRPGGRLVMTVPFAARWHFIPFDYWRYTPSSLNQLLTGAGFDSVCVRARGNPLTVACYKAMSLVLLLLFGTGSGGMAWVKRLLGLLLLPAFALLACVANLSMQSDWGDDCLGYTVTARRP